MQTYVLAVAFHLSYPFNIFIALAQLLFHSIELNHRGVRISERIFVTKSDWSAAKMCFVQAKTVKIENNEKNATKRAAKHNSGWMMTSSFTRCTPWLC